MLAKLEKIFRFVINLKNCILAIFKSSTLKFGVLKS